ncbi:MAG: hypothetical protein AAF658_17640, partial [Myxococcota bacterium]
MDRRVLGFTVLCFACDSADDPTGSVRGEIDALINIPVASVLSSTLLVGPTDESLLLLEHSGTLVLDGTSYGAEDEVHLIGLRFASDLRVVWVRDYGVVNQPGFAGGRWGATQVTLLLAQGTMQTASGAAEAPAFVRIALADGVAIDSIAINRDGGAVEPLSVVGSASSLSVVGRFLPSTTAEASESTSELWVARYPPDVSGGMLWERFIASEGGDAEGLDAAVDRSDNLVLRGRSEGPLGELQSIAGTFIAKLGTTQGDVLWTRAISPSAD